MLSIINDEPKRVLAIVGSPRRKGNTEILVDEILSGTEENGALTQKMILSDLDIAPCRGCDSCKKTGKCIHQDDMPELVARMQSSDVWILAFPIYWWAPPSHFKAFLDRWHGISNRDVFVDKEIVLVLTMEGTKTSNYTPILDMFKGIMEHLKMKLVATVLVQGVYEKGAVHGHPDKIAYARNVGFEVTTN